MQLFMHEPGKVIGGSIEEKIMGLHSILKQQEEKDFHNFSLLFSLT